jgi:hypothetical protein
VLRQATGKLHHAKISDRLESGDVVRLLTALTKPSNQLIKRGKVCCHDDQPYRFASWSVR